MPILRSKERKAELAAITKQRVLNKVSYRTLSASEKNKRKEEYAVFAKIGRYLAWQKIKLDREAEIERELNCYRIPSSWSCIQDFSKYYFITKRSRRAELEKRGPRKRTGNWSWGPEYL